jgi:hypothetical protein
MKELSKKDMAILGFVLLLYTVVISSLSYYSGKHSHICEPETIEIETLCYSLDPGTDGIIKVRMDQDSLYYTVFVHNKDTFALDALNQAEFDSLVSNLYP